MVAHGVSRGWAYQRGKPRRGDRKNAFAIRSAAPLGLDFLFAIIPRLMPWATIYCCSAVKRTFVDEMERRK